MRSGLSILGSFALLLSSSIGSFGAEPVFSSLPKVQQQAIRAMVAPPPASERNGPYSTPMYYLFRKGYAYKGDYDRNPNSRPHPNMVGKPLTPDYGHWELDRNRPDWQEAIIKDWADLGLNSTHFNIYPDDSRFILSEDYAQAIKDFTDLSQKHGLRVGVRLDAADWWSMNPNNPNNLIDKYIENWINKVVPLTKGKVLYYVLGDELVWKANPPYYEIPKEQEWSAALYMKYFKKMSTAIKKIDPEAKVSMYATSVGYYDQVRELLDAGYANYGDAIAVNSSDIASTNKLFAEVRKRYPKMMFVSNGVGYLASAQAQPQYPVGTPYDQIPTDEAHGNAIIKIMFTWWDAGATAAPYYLSLREYKVDGKQYPYWYGLFGFEGYDIEKDKLSVERFPDWYAFQTLTHTFYNRELFKKPGFKVTSSAALTMCNAYTHQVKGGTELVMMLWNNAGPVHTSISLGSAAFAYPVHINTFDYSKWSDIPATKTPGGLKFDLDVGSDPVMIRLVRSN